MVIFLYYRMRVVTSFSHLRCLVIALTSSIPVFIHKVLAAWEIAGRYLVELGFILGGTSAEEINEEYRKKLDDLKEEE